MRDPDYIQIFRSARTHLAAARAQDALCRNAWNPAAKDAAAEAYMDAVEALVKDLTQLDEAGILDLIEVNLAGDTAE